MSVLAGLLALSAAGCGGKSMEEVVNGDSGSSSGSKSNIIYAEDGYAQGAIGDTLGTAWFNFTVNSASLEDSYGGTVMPDEGEKLLVVNVTLNNTISDDLPMFDADFQAQWGAEGENDYRYPVTDGKPELQTGDMLAEEYTLGAGDTITGDLVFSVPGGHEEYSLSFMEYFDNDESGDMFFVYFKLN